MPALSLRDFRDPEGLRSPQTSGTASRIVTLVTLGKGWEVEVASSMFTQTIFFPMKNVLELISICCIVGWKENLHLKPTESDDTWAEQECSKFNCRKLGCFSLKET